MARRLTDNPRTITNISDLEDLYGHPSQKVVERTSDVIEDRHREYIERATFAVVASSGSHGPNASLRGGLPGFVAVEDDRTLVLPDRPGNNRLDTLRNVVENPYVGLALLAPGPGQSLRIRGSATISTNPALLDRFVEDREMPLTALIIRVKSVYFQCRKAVVRAGNLGDSNDMPPQGTNRKARDIMSFLTKVWSPVLVTFATVQPHAGAAGGALQLNAVASSLARPLLTAGSALV